MIDRVSGSELLVVSIQIVSPSLGNDPRRIQCN
jgi:hypothetical protein